MRVNLLPTVLKGMSPAHTHTLTLLRDQDLIVSVVDKLGRFEVSRTVGETTTHVVCGNPRRTINILAATAMGCWVLSADWVCAVIVV